MAAPDRLELADYCGSGGSQPLAPCSFCLPCRHGVRVEDEQDAFAKHLVTRQLTQLFPPRAVTALRDASAGNRSAAGQRAAEERPCRHGPAWQAG